MLRRTVLDKQLLYFLWLVLGDNLTHIFSLSKVLYQNYGLWNINQQKTFIIQLRLSVLKNKTISAKHDSSKTVKRSKNCQSDIDVWCVRMPSLEIKWWLWCRVATSEEVAPRGAAWIMNRRSENLDNCVVPTPNTYLSTVVFNLCN